MSGQLKASLARLTVWVEGSRKSSSFLAPCSKTPKHGNDHDPMPRLPFELGDPWTEGKIDDTHIRLMIKDTCESRLDSCLYAVKTGVT